VVLKMKLMLECLKINKLYFNFIIIENNEDKGKNKVDFKKKLIMESLKKKKI